MKLMTKGIEKSLPRLYSQKHTKDPPIFVIYFHPFSTWVWYGIEYDPEQRLFFGYVIGHEPELGYFSLDELESVKVHGLGIERDLYFNPCPLSKVKVKNA